MKKKWIPLIVTLAFAAMSFAACDDSHSEHEYVKTESKSATCTQDGNREYYTCTGCDGIWLDANGAYPTNAKSVVLPATGHTFGKEWYSTATGHYRRCTVCDTGSEVTEHQIVAVGETSEPTCTVAGSTAGEKCGICNYTVTERETVPSLGHTDTLSVSTAKTLQEGDIPTLADFNVFLSCGRSGCERKEKLTEHLTLTPATALTVGENKLTFAYSYDGTELTKEYAVVIGHIHSPEETPAKAATCTENGTKGYWYCTGCGNYYEDEACEHKTTVEERVVVATGHSHALSVTLTEANFKEGDIPTIGSFLVKLVCANCDSEETVTEHLTLSPSAALVKGENTLTVTYAFGNTVLQKEIKVTAQEKGHVHNPVETPAKAATCTENGTQGYWYCAGCGNYYLEEACTTPTTAEERLILAAGHSYRLNAVPVRSDYRAGDTITAADFTVTLVCEKNDFSQLLTEGYELSKTVLDEGENSVTVSYSSGAINATVTVTLTAAHVHNPVETPAKAATCTEEGTQGYWYCAGCGNYYEEETCTTPTTVEERVTPATGHKNVLPVAAKQATLTEEGNVAHYLCADCEGCFADEACEQPLENVVIPRQVNLSVGDNNVTVKRADGTSVGKGSSNKKVPLVQGDPQIGGNKWYGEIIFSYNVHSTQAVTAGLYLDVSARTQSLTVNKMYYIIVNGVKYEVDNSIGLPDGADSWNDESYVYVGDVSLREGINDITVIRLNIATLLKDSYSNYFRNFFGIKLGPQSATEISIAANTVTRCGICGHRTDAAAPSDDKCTGHTVNTENNKTTQFSVMDDKVLATTNKNTAANEQNISCNSSNVGYGTYTVTYYISASEATTAKLYIKTSSQTDYNSLAESYSFRVNGAEVVTGGYATMPYKDASGRWNTFRYTCVGEIALKAGVNKIEIIRPDNSNRETVDYKEYANYNFFGIAFDGTEAELALTEKPAE